MEALEAKPREDSVSRTVVAGSSNVKFVRQESGNDPVLGLEPVVKQIYSAPNRETAIEFLRSTPVERRMFFIEVDTPEGRVGRDINGLYDQNGNIGESSKSPICAYRLIATTDSN
jgi:hypothetical protein